MTDRIEIRDLLVRAILGINPDERTNRQDVLVNAILHVDVRAAAASDTIVDAVNYSAISHAIITLAQGARYHLVEKLVSEIAWLCLDDDRIAAVTVRVEKPTALRFARSVGVEITRTREERRRHASPVYVSIGSNIDAEHNMPRAVGLLAARCRVEAVSPVYESKPVDGSPQPCYLDAVVRASTTLAPRVFRERVLRPIEAEMGRVRSGDRFAPRTIDLDLLLYGDRVQMDGDLIVPAEEISQYAHVAVPLADLAPALWHPERDETMSSIAARVNGGGLARRNDIVLWPQH